MLLPWGVRYVFVLMLLICGWFGYGCCMMCNSNVLLLQRFFYWGLELDACVIFYTCMGSCRRSIIVFLYISDVYFCFGY